MIIKLRHAIAEVEIRTSHNHSDEPVTAEFVCEHAIAIETLKDELSGAYGFYGHTINPELLNNLDLYSACLSLPSFVFLSADPVPQPSLLPEGVQS